MLHIEIGLLGTTAMLHNNDQMADPDHPLSVELAKISSKAKKTPADREQMDCIWILTSTGHASQPTT